MDTSPRSTPSVEPSEFAREAQQARPSVLGEFGQFLISNKKWWLTPIILLLLLIGLVAALGGTAAAPFIYTLF